MAITPIQLLRIGGVLACCLDGAFTVLARLRQPNVIANLGDEVFGVDYPLRFLVVTDVMAFGLIAAAFWYLSQEKHMASPNWVNVSVLTLQAVLTALICPGVNYIGSAQAGFLLAPKAGVWWVVGQSALEVALAARYSAVAADLLPPHMLQLKGGLLWSGMISMALVYHFLAYSLGYLAANAVKQKRELERRNAELEATQQIEADSARLAERLTIARDLHDELGHHLTRLSLNLQLASKQTDGPAKETIDRAYLLARTVLSDIRSTVTDLRETQAVQLPIALQTLTRGIAQPTVHLSIGERMDRVDPLPSHAIFRSAQEIITNTIRHAQARNLWLDLRHEEAVYVLEARDDGRGAELLRLGNGLRGLVERVENLGGTVRFGAEGGFGLRIELPLKSAP